MNSEIMQMQEKLTRIEEKLKACPCGDDVCEGCQEHMEEVDLLKDELEEYNRDKFALMPEEDEADTPFDEIGGLVK